MSEAIHRIRLCENNKPISVIHDELGYALGREGGSAIAYWRKGNIPKLRDLENLAGQLMKRSDLDRAWLMRFLEAAEHPYPDKLVHRHFHANGAARPPDAVALATPLGNLQLKAAHHELIGRDKERRELLRLLADPDAPAILAVDGGGGIGKTALAYAVANECRKRNHFDAIFWMEASAGAPGEVDALTLNRVLRLLGHYLAIADFAQLPEVELFSNLHMLLSTRRVLLVLDNLETSGEPQEELIQGLRPLLGVSRALLVSRRRFVGDVYALHLTGLDADHFHDFIQQEARLRGLFMVEGAPATELHKIFTATGGSPLAIKLIVGQLGFLPMEFVLECLHDIALLNSQDKRDEYAQLYTDLFLPTWTQLSVAARQLLVGISLFVPGLGGSLDAIRAVSELSMRELYVALNELWRVSFLEVVGAQRGNLHNKRYYLHTLTRNFVHLSIDAQSDHMLREERTRSALDFINYYITYATSNANDSAALLCELDNLTTTLRMVHDLSQPDLLLLGAQVICPQLLEQGRYAEAIIHLERAEVAARKEKADQSLTSILLQLGIALQKHGQVDTAQPRLQEALALAQALADAAMQRSIEEAIGNCR